MAEMMCFDTFNIKNSNHLFLPHFTKLLMIKTNNYNIWVINLRNFFIRFERDKPLKDQSHII